MRDKKCDCRWRSRMPLREMNAKMWAAAHCAKLILFSFFFIILELSKATAVDVKMKRTGHKTPTLFGKANGRVAVFRVHERARATYFSFGLIKMAVVRLEKRPHHYSSFRVRLRALLRHCRAVFGFRLRSPSFYTHRFGVFFFIIFILRFERRRRGNVCRFMNDILCEAKRAKLNYCDCFELCEWRESFNRNFIAHCASRHFYSIIRLRWCVHAKRFYSSISWSQSWASRAK